MFRRYGEAYRDQHGGSLSTAQRHAMSAIELCRTAALGGHVEHCDSCDHQRIAYNSCRNRNCPKCQSLARARWLADRQAELLDTQYFHVVFTVPDEVAVIAFQNKPAVYDILFRAASETLRTIAADPAHLGAEIGFLAVLHTWGQNLLHHPHLHCLVPGGGISPDGSQWVACRPGFFLPVRVLSRLFRGLFLHYLEKAFTAGHLNFFSTLQSLQERSAFLRHLAPDTFPLQRRVTESRSRLAVQRPELLDERAGPFRSTASSIGPTDGSRWRPGDPWPTVRQVPE
mgnify:CR=1 FL=1